MLFSSCGTSSRSQSDEWDLVDSGSNVDVGRGAGISVPVAAGDDTVVLAGTGARDDTIDAGSATDPSSAGSVGTFPLAFKPADEASAP